MENINIALGTTSDQKIKYLEEVISELGFTACIISVKTDSGVSEQPMTEDETMTGSVNRAVTALCAVPEANVGLGIEVGYNPIDGGKYEIFCFASIVNNDQELLSQKSYGFILPRFHQQIIEKNISLSDHVRDYIISKESPVERYLGEAIRGRELFIKDSLRRLFIYYLAKKEFDY